MATAADVALAGELPELVDLSLRLAVVHLHCDDVAGLVDLELLRPFLQAAAAGVPEWIAAVGQKHDPLLAAGAYARLAGAASRACASRWPGRASRPNARRKKHGESPRRVIAWIPAAWASVPNAKPCRRGVWDSSSGRSRLQALAICAAGRAVCMCALADTSDAADRASSASRSLASSGGFA